MKNPVIQPLIQNEEPAVIPPLLASAAITAYGIYRRGPMGASLIFSGVALGYFAWLNHRKRQSPMNDAALTPTPLDRHFGTVGADKRDRVEEASWESFPASDSPAW